MSYTFRKYSVHTSENNEFGSSAESSAFFPLLDFSPKLRRIYNQKTLAKNSENNPKLSIGSRELSFLAHDQRTGLSYAYYRVLAYHILHISNLSRTTQF